MIIHDTKIKNIKIDNSNNAYINSTYVFIDSKNYFRMKYYKSFFKKAYQTYF